jgi:predicted permease
VKALLARIGSDPRVDSASAGMGLPFTTGLNALTGFRHEGEPEPDSASMPNASLRIVETGYFATLRIPVRAGRVFSALDTPGSPEVAVVNEETARRFFAGASPIGRQIRISAELSRHGRAGPKTIVGVVGDVKSGGLDEDTPAEIYLPYDQQPVNAFTVAVRAKGEALALVPTLRQQVAALDPLLPMANVKSLGQLLDAAGAERRLTLVMFLLFGAIAVALSAVGVYGVLAYLVSQRTREIGVRLAIGASPSDVVRLVVREGGVLILVGAGAGLAGAIAGGRWIAALLFGVTPADPAAFAAAVLTLGVTAAFAIYLPARRAARIDPAEALKAD